MKNLFLVIPALVLCQPMVFSQGCLPEGITFTTQEQIDNFQVNYPGCSEIEGNVMITGSEIENLDGLGGVTSIMGNLQIKSNDILRELTGLQNLEYLGGDLGIEQNDVLVNLHGLENLANLNGDLIIGDIVLGQYPYSTGNPLITSLAGLNNLTTIQGTLKLCGNYSLTSLSGLENLAIIGGNLQVGGIEFVYGFTFGNPLLANFSGLAHLSAIGGGLFIAGNSNLANLSGLDSLLSIGQHCWFDMNESLATLQGLNRLGSIGGRLNIRWNAALTNISGLENIAAQSIQDLEISGNLALAQCNIQSICNYLAGPGGNVFIEYNATGCNSPEEVEAVCEASSVTALLLQTSISLYPNPANDKVTISSSAFAGKTRLSLFTLPGLHIKEKIITGTIARLDISNLPPGMYIVELATDEWKVRKKLMIQ